MSLFFEKSQRSLRARADGSKYSSLTFADANSSLWPFDSGRVEPLNSSEDTSVFLKPLPVKEEVLRFLLHSDEEDAIWVLDGVLSDRPELLHQQLEKLRPVSTTSTRQTRLGSLQFEATPALIERGSGVVFETRRSVAASLARDSSLVPTGGATLGAARRVAKSTRLSVQTVLAQMRDASSLTQEVAAELSRARKTEAEQELLRRRIYVTDPQVQFSSMMYYYTEGECETQLEVVRIGNTQTRSKVLYETVDATGMAGHKFVAKAGTLIFEPGEDKQYINIELVDDELWGTTTEFHVKLKSEGLVGAILGKYLWQARVIITDDETFPTSRFKDEILEDRLEEIPKFQLLCEYFKMNIQSKRKILHGTVKILFVEQVHNLATALRLLMNLYLVDFVLKQEMPEDQLFFDWDRITWLIVIALSILVQCAVLHLVDYRKYSWGVAGLSRHTLQTALLTKFLNYDETSRSTLRMGDLVLSVTRDSERLVQMGYMGLLDLCQNLGQFMILVSVRITLGLLRDNRKNQLIVRQFTGIFMVLVVPFIKVPFLSWRKDLNMSILDNMHRRQNEVAHQIEQTVSNYRLIADYNRRPYFQEKFNIKVQEYNRTSLIALQARQNNQYFGKWLTAMMIGAYTLMGGINVLQDTLTLGTFLADIHIFTTIGEAWNKIFHIILDMQLVLPDLVRMVNFLNLSIDVPHKMKLHRSNECVGKQMLAEIVRRADLPAVEHDCLPIVIQDIEFKFNAKMVKDGIKTNLGSMSGYVNINQGVHVSLVGPRGEGKSTLLKIIGGVNLAISNKSGSQFFIPAHLRVLHVSTEPMFFHGTLLENICFGVADGHSDRNIDRVLSICERTGLPQFIQKLILKEETHAWEDLSQTQKHLLNFARALISNPELMCIHKPVQVFDSMHARKILAMLKEFVVSKGIEQGATQEHYRRPRTCISTSSTLLGVELADIVYHVSHADGIKEMLKDEVSTDMLG